jgi:hypothetical protein
VTDAVASPVADPAVRPARSRPPDDALAAAAVALLAVGAVVGAVQVWRTGWTPSADQAFIEFRVRDVPGDPPLLGVFSRYGWSHPGPALFYLLAVPYRLAGGASESLAAAALAAQVLVVAVTAFLARRLDRLAGITVLVALQIVLLTAGAAVRWSPRACWWSACGGPVNVGGHRRRSWCPRRRCSCSPTPPPAPSPWRRWFWRGSPCGGRVATRSRRVRSAGRSRGVRSVRDSSWARCCGCRP